LQANAAFIEANTATNNAAGASLYANAAFLAANNSTDTWVRGAANAASSYANSAYIQANTATTNASVADDKAVTAGSYANSAFLQANTAATNALSAGLYANAAFLAANNAVDTWVRDAANAASSYANSAFNKANSALTLTGGTIAGNVTANSFIANTSVYSPVFYSTGGTTKLELTDIGLVSITSNGQEFKFGGSGIETSQGIFGGTFGGNRLSLNNETNVISNRYDTVKIQTGTDGTTVNDFVFANTSLTVPGGITANGFTAGGINVVPTLASSFLHANAAFLAANNSTDTWVRGAANAASSYANSAYTQANTATTNAATADGKAVTSGSYANSAFLHANAAFAAANASSGGAGTPVSVTTNKFTANGSTSTFNLTVTPDNENLVTAVVDGIVQLRDTYILTGSTIGFDSTIYAGANVEITTISGGGGGTSSAAAVGYSLIFGG
jgi:hypothetical protein